MKKKAFFLLLSCTAGQLSCATQLPRPEISSSTTTKPDHIIIEMPKQILYSIEDLFLFELPLHLHKTAQALMKEKTNISNFYKKIEIAALTTKLRPQDKLVLKIYFERCHAYHASQHHSIRHYARELYRYVTNFIQPGADDRN